MPRFRLAGLLGLALMAGAAGAAEGPVAIKSPYGVKEAVK